MKLKSVYTYCGLIILGLVLLIWKLNDYYKSEKSAYLQNQIQQQNINIKTSIAGQLTQLKNNISSYQGLISETQINWIQLNPFFTLSQVEINSQGQYKFKNLFVKSGTAADNWSIEYLQKALSYTKHSGLNVHAQLFQNQNADKFLALVFTDVPGQKNRQGVVLVSEAFYFQKYFDIQKQGKSINVLMTKDQIVAGHTQSDYVATRSKELQLNSKQYYYEKDEINASNLIIASYSLKKSKGQFLFIPPFLSSFIFGLSCIIIGLFLYLYKPEEQLKRKAAQITKAFDEVQNNKKSNSEFIKPETAALAEKIEPFSEQSINWLSAKNNESHGMTKSQTSFSEPTQSIEVVAPTKSQYVQVQKIAIDAQKIFSSLVSIEVECTSLKKYELDSNRFRKAFENIFHNSIEAGATEILVKIFDIENDSCIEITDNGTGLPDLSSDKIWQPYFTTKDKLKHKGLGLPEALSIVRRYSGDIKIESNSHEFGRGTRVKIFMNAEQADEKLIDQNHVIHTTDSSTGLMTLDIDIDTILNLDDLSDTDAFLKNELTPKNVRVEEKLSTQSVPIENPEITINIKSRPVDDLSFKIRKPGKG